MNKVRRSIVLMVMLIMVCGGSLQASYLFDLLEHGQSEVLAECIRRSTKARVTTWRTLKDEDGSPLLHTAVFLEDMVAVRALVAHGADLNTADSALMTPLHIAARDRRLDIMRCLIRAGAELDYHDIDGYAPIHYAVLKDEDLEERDDSVSVEVTKLLIESGAFLDAANDDGATPLHLAVDNGNASLISILLAAGANPRVLNNAGRTPLDLAIQNNHEMAGRLLAVHGAYTHKPDLDGDTPLHNAAASGSEELVRFFVEEAGARLDVKNQCGETPLNIAVTLKNRALIAYFMVRGASFELPLQWLDLALSRKQQEKAAGVSGQPTVLGTRMRESSSLSSGDQRSAKRQRVA